MQFLFLFFSLGVIFCPFLLHVLCLCLTDFFAAIILMHVCFGTNVAYTLLKLIYSIVFRDPLYVLIWSRYSSFDMVIFGLETAFQAASVLLLARTYFWSSQKCVNYLNTLCHDRVLSLNLQVSADEFECWKQIPVVIRNFINHCCTFTCSISVINNDKNKFNLRIHITDSRCLISDAYSIVSTGHVI